MLNFYLADLKKDTYIWSLKTLITFIVVVIWTIYAFQEWGSAPELGFTCTCMYFISLNFLAPVSLWFTALLLLIKTRTLRLNWKNISNEYRLLKSLS